MQQLFICGMPGSGKSSLAGPLAQKIGVSSYDLDQLIENMKGKRVPEILKQEGEAAFRQYETIALNEFIEKNKSNGFVLALGGGTVCFNNNIEQVKNTGTLIYLKTSVDFLVKRLSGNLENRPLLNNGVNLKPSLSKLMEQREQFYLQADIVIENSGKPDQLIEEIEISLKKINRH